MAKHLHVEGQLPLWMLDSSWSPPVGPLPLIRDDDIAIDTETRDNGLARGTGPGWHTRDGYVLGASVAWSGGSIYVPVAHPDTECRPIGEVVAWIDHLMLHNRCHFFNGPYDLGWMRAEGCKVWPERMEDGQAMAVLSDENWDTYSLDDCCARIGIPGKDETLLREAAASLGIGKINGSIKHGLWRMPARYVGPYAEQDAVATLEQCRRQMRVLESEQTVGAYRTEIALMEVIHHMKKRGIRVSESAATEAQAKIRVRVREELVRIETPPLWHRRATIDDLRSPTKLAEIFNHHGIEYPVTAKTKQPSFTKDFLKKNGSPTAKLVMLCRQLEDLGEKFLGTYILEHVHRGRIHPEIHQLRDEDGGARTLRLSISNPPMQQMPSRDPELAPIIRGAFLPEEGTHWLAADLKGQEPRLVTHYAKIAEKAAAKYNIRMGGIDEFVEYYRHDPNPDAHAFTAKILGLTRKETKDLTQALSYRMSAKKLAWHLNCSLEDASEKWTLFHTKIPYIQGLAKFAEMRARTHGYVAMIDGARRHFPFWQQPRRDREGDEEESTYARRAEAEKLWPNSVLERAFAFQAGNSLIQGSAARQIKKSLVDCYRAGYLALLSVHDENDFSVTSPRECEEIGELMENAIKLTIPVTTDREVGVSWGKATTDYRKYQW